MQKLVLYGRSHHVHIYMEQDSTRIGYILPMFWALKQMFNACPTPEGEFSGHKKSARRQEMNERSTAWRPTTVFLPPSCPLPYTLIKKAKPLVGFWESALRLSIQRRSWIRQKNQWSVLFLFCHLKNAGVNYQWVVRTRNVRSNSVTVHYYQCPFSSFFVLFEKS